MQETGCDPSQRIAGPKYELPQLTRASWQKRKADGSTGPNEPVNDQAQGYLRPCSYAFQVFRRTRSQFL